MSDSLYFLSSDGGIFIWILMACGMSPEKYLLFFNLSGSSCLYSNGFGEIVDGKIGSTGKWCFGDSRGEE